MSTCQNNSEKSSTAKLNIHKPSGCLLFTYCSFDATKIKLDFYRGKNCVKTFFKNLTELATKLMNYENIK